VFWRVGWQARGTVEDGDVFNSSSSACLTTPLLLLQVLGLNDGHLQAVSTYVLAVRRDG